MGNFLSTSFSEFSAAAASASSTSSNAFVLASLFTASSLVLLLLRHFIPLRTTPAYLLIPIFLALTLPISIILLVPIDLASSSRTNDEATRGIWLPERTVLVAWRITYWLTFALTWIILPLLGEYTDSGFRTPRDRILYSLRSNARYQLIVLGCGTAGLVYVFWSNGFEGTSVKSLIMALAYCWALIQAIYLMGHGLVAVPRRLFRNANVSGRLRRIQSQAPKVHEKLQDAITEVRELEGQVAQLRQRKTGISRDHQEWVQDLAEDSNITDSYTTPSSVTHGSGAPVPAVVTDRYLADLSRRLNRARHKRLRFTERWDRLVQEAARTQTILDASALKKLDFGKAAPHASVLERFTILTPYTRHLLHYHVMPAAQMALGSVLSLASICIVWSELIKNLAPKLSLVSLTVIHHRKNEYGKVGFAGQVTASLWILYMCATALASFDDIKVWGNRALVRRNTYGESACWYAGQVAKLTVPLAYNFITFLPQAVHRKTTFYHFLGRLIVLTPLGKGFDYFFPILILVPVCATLFNLYGKAKRILGFRILEDDEDENPTGYATADWREGRSLIEGDLSGRPDLGSATLLAGSSHRRPVDDHNPIRQSAHAPDIPPIQRNERAQRQADRLTAATQAAEEEDENVFSGFAHRVRNTIDNVERPEWLSDLGKRPKWMGGRDGDQGGGQTESGRGLGRWFGGRPPDGRVRL
ncbi:MAG: hypothetical protein Q9187_000729 [Circinaria calcarea]